MCRTVNTGFGLDADRLLDETPTELFEEWRTLYEMEPWADERSDLAAGRMTMHLVGALGKEARAPKEYMPLLERGVQKKRQQTEDDMKKIWSAASDAMQRRLDRLKEPRQ